MAALATRGAPPSKAVGKVPTYAPSQTYVL